MEFLKALEQAQAMGLTKDEFFNVWESESKLRQKIKREDSASQGIPYGEQPCSQNQDNDDRGSSVDPVVHQFTQNSHQTRPEFRQDLHVKSEHPCWQLMEKHEQLLQQMHLKYDQLQYEFQSRFEILSHHISNTADSHADSLKLYFMQEVDLLKQDLRRLLQEQNTRHETVILSSDVASQKMSLGSSKDALSYQNNFNFIQPDYVGSGSINNDNKVKQNLNKSPKNVQQNQQEFELSDLPHPGGYNEMDGDFNSVARSGQRAILGQKKLYPEAEKYLPSKSYANVAAVSTIVEKTSLSYSSKFDRSNEKFVDASAANLTKGSVAAKGLFADVIASQMKQKQSSRPSSVKSSTISEYSDHAKATPREKTTQSGATSSLPAGETKHYKFTITNISQFRSLNQIFLSSFNYSKGKGCRARVGIKFTKSGKLTVQFLVSKGKQDDNHKWPLILDGTGYIIYPGSKQGTHLWHLNSAICDKPRSAEDELIFPAEVCLMTSKQNYSDVTYNDLIIRYKVGEDSLMLTWDLQATERQNMPETASAR